MIFAEKANFPVTMMCRLMRVSRSGFYAWLKRGVSQREKANERLLVHIRDAFRRSRGTYGSPRIVVELRARGLSVGHNRVARLMQQDGLQGRRKKRFRATTDSNHDLAVAPNLLDRQFEVHSPDSVWVADITCLWTDEGWLYLATVLDLFSRRVVGWAMDDNMRKELALRALEMAIKQRKPAHGLLHHSDQGSQYASKEYRDALTAAGIVCSMSRRGECYDNAVAESFFSTLEAELESRCKWHSRLAAKTAIHDFIEVFYNRQRRHSHIGNVSPDEYERTRLTAA